MEDVIWKQKNAAFLWLILASVCAVLLYAVYWFTDTGGKKKKKDKPVPVQVDARVGGGRQRARRMRVRQDSDNEDNPGFSDEDEWLDDGKAEGKVGAKKQRKLEMKAEKRENRMAELESREERKKQEALLAAERKKKEEQKRKEEEDREEHARLLKEEQERKEYEEYLKLKQEFDIEESGDGGILTEQESQALLQQFIDFIKTSKVVQLEDVATRFSLKTQDVIDRLENLQEDGRITGVMDDRGKFIYISQDELEKVAKFIKQRGRISIAELAESSNTLIKLEESKIIEESSKVIEAAA